jgi:predicted Zn-dependent protease with MMP-like domain
MKTKTDKVAEWLAFVFALGVVISVVVFVNNRRKELLDQKEVEWAYKVIVVDGCQYIEMGNRVVAHKGNCTNSIHIYNK